LGDAELREKDTNTNQNRHGEKKEGVDGPGATLAWKVPFQNLKAWPTKTKGTHAGKKVFKGEKVQNRGHTAKSPGAHGKNRGHYRPGNRRKGTWA